MSADQQHFPAGPEVLDGYLAAMEDEGAPLLGHLVLYSIFSGEVTPALASQWFRELGLNEAFAPGEIRAVDVYERITGPSGVKRAYPIGPVQTRRQRREEGGRAREGLLMIRHVSRSNTKIVRHLVREVRDEEQIRLSYDARLAVITFARDRDENAAAGAGALKIEPDRGSIAALPGPEQQHVEELLGEVRQAFATGRLFLSADKLRSVVRSYVESLRAIKVRPTGGVYFVGRQYAQTLSALRELVRRFGGGSYLTRVPLPDQDEMREMVIGAFVTRSKEELDRLARDIAAAMRDGQTGQAAIQALHKRFAGLQAAAAEHEQLLGGSIDDAQASMRLVQVQLAGLLAQAS
jgi:hypothetical protein